MAIFLDNKKEMLVLCRHKFLCQLLSTLYQGGAVMQKRKSNGNSHGGKYGWHLDVILFRGNRCRNKTPDFSSDFRFDAYNLNHALTRGHKLLKAVVGTQNRILQLGCQYIAKATIVSGDGKHRFSLRPQFCNHGVLMTQRPKRTFERQGH